MKYYIASKWVNMKAVQALTENLQELGHEVFSYVDDSRNFVPSSQVDQTRNEVFEISDDWQNREGLKKMFDSDLAGLTQCDCFIMLMPAGRGVHMQAGIAYGFNKQMVLIGELESVEVHYMMFDQWHKNIESYLAGLKSKQ